MFQRHRLRLCALGLACSTVLVSLPACRQLAGYDPTTTVDPEQGPLTPDLGPPTADLAGPWDALVWLDGDPPPLEASIADATVPETHWVRAIGAIGSGSGSEAWGVAMSPADEAIVVGTTTAPLLTTLVPTGFGGDDIFVIRYGSLGKVGWGKLYGSSGADQGRAITTGGGRLKIGGFIAAEADIGGPNGTLVASDQDAFLANYDYAGKGTGGWAYQSTGADELIAVVADGDGYCIAVTARGTITGIGPSDLSSPTSQPDVVVACFDSSDSNLWAKALGGNGIDEAAALALSPDGTRLFLAAKATGNGAYGGLSLPMQGSVSDVDLVVAAFDRATGDHKWSKRWGGSAGDLGRGLAVSNDGSTLAVIGQTASAPANFDIQKLSRKGGFDGFVVLVSSDDGGVNKVLQLGGTSTIDARAITAFDSKEFVVTGAYRGTLDYAGFGSATGPSTSNSLFLLRLDTAGNVLGTLEVKSTASSAVDPRGIAAANNGDVVVVGHFGGAIDFRGVPKTSQGSQDAFVWRTKAP